MKRTLFKTLITLLLATFMVLPNYAQGGWLNRAKDALSKKNEKKKEETVTPAKEPKTTVPTNASTNVPASAMTTTPEPATLPPPAVSDIGTIYFSNQPFTNGTEGSKTTFTSNEFIYARLVLKNGTIREVLKPKPPTDQIGGYYFAFKFYVHKDSSGYPQKADLFIPTKVVLSEAQIEKNTWDFDVFPAPEKMGTRRYWGGNSNNGYIAVSDIYDFLTNDNDKQSEGTYTFGITLTSAGVDFRGNDLPDGQQTKITNEFSFTFRGADFAAIKANQEKIKKSFGQLMAHEQYVNQQLPPEWNLPSNPVIRGLTEAQLRTMYINHFAAKDRPDLQIVRFHARPASSSVLWTVENNEFGIPRYRYTNQWFFMFVKNTRENACFFQGFGLRQNYSGGGTFGPAFIDKNEAITWFQCEKMKDAATPAAPKTLRSNSPIKK